MIKRLLLLCGLLLFVFPTLSAKRVSQATKNKLNHELPILGLSVGDEVFIRTFKKEKRLELWIRPETQQQFILFRTYPICYYSGRLGPKIRRGDKVTPEGFYRITKKDLNPYSRFHLSLDIGYPNTYDRQFSRTGSMIKIHGACDAVGCFAMSNLQIEEIYYLVQQALKNGQNKIPVHSFPFHLTDENLSQYQDSKWFDFWQQLQVGYRLFNETKIPPIIDVENKRYMIYSSE
ncbi:MAG: murein L,D-transpeptidase [Gammaproteobacteria bacterium]|nr:murein L,D-transpeptidase [Gammaproteobacteria bacterium]